MQHMQRPKMVGDIALHKKLGSGSFASVYLGIKPDGSKSAVKAIKSEVRAGAKRQHVTYQTFNSSLRSSHIPLTYITNNLPLITSLLTRPQKLTKKVKENLDVEISILGSFNHAHIVRMWDVFKTNSHIYLILEYCSGGDLQELIRGRKKGRLSERVARRLMSDLCMGLQFLNSREVIHRDIKPQNLLLTNPLPPDEVDDPAKDASAVPEHDLSIPFQLKIADFGFARQLDASALAKTLCGSPLYMAPEILGQKPYNSNADLWSTGTVLFEMIAGKVRIDEERRKAGAKDGWSQATTALRSKATTPSGRRFAPRTYRPPK